MRDVSFPPSLVELQTWFASMMVPPITESDSANIPIYSPSLIEQIDKIIAPSPTLKSEERMAIYRQQYWWRLLTIMQEIFPSLVAIFDYEAFNCKIAEPYLTAYPPQDWFISKIGSDLIEWLEKYYREDNASLLIELARIDLAYESLLFAEVLPRIDPKTISECKRKKIFLQPFVLLFQSNADVFSLHSELLKHPPSHWQENPLPEIKKSRKKRFIVLYPGPDKNVYDEISSSFFALLSRFQKGARLNDLVPLLENCEEIVSYFQLMASRGWLTLQEPRSKA